LVISLTDPKASTKICLPIGFDYAKNAPFIWSCSQFDSLSSSIYALKASHEAASKQLHLLQERQLMQQRVDEAENLKQQTSYEQAIRRQSSSAQNALYNQQLLTLKQKYILLQAHHAEQVKVHLQQKQKQTNDLLVQQELLRQQHVAAPPSYSRNVMYLNTSFLNRSNSNPLTLNDFILLLTNFNFHDILRILEGSIKK
jgi:hypothetical protein